MQMLRFRKFVEDAGVGLAPVAANHMGASSSNPGTGGIDTVDPLMRKRADKRKLLVDVNKKGETDAIRYR